MKLSIFVFNTQNSDDQVNTLRYRNSTLITKKCWYRIGFGILRYSECLATDRIGKEKKNGIGASLIVI